MTRRDVFDARILPIVLVLPHLIVAAVFVLWPAAETLVAAVGAPGAKPPVSGMRFAALFDDPTFLRTLGLTLIYAGLLTALAIGLALLLALAASAPLTGRSLYRHLLVWPVAVAPAAAGLIWAYLLDPSGGALIGWVDGALASALGLWREAVSIVAPHVPEGIGLSAPTDPAVPAWAGLAPETRALMVLTVASVWKQLGFNVLIFLVALQSIPRSLIEAAALDHAGPWRRFWKISLPMLAPALTFLLVVNLVYALTESFGTAHVLAALSGGAANPILVAEAYAAHAAGDTGRAAAISCILAALVALLVLAQLRGILRRGRG